MGAINLVESPEDIFGRSLSVVTTGVVREVVHQWGAANLLLEKIDFVEEKDDTGPEEPSRIDDGIEKYKALHHSVLQQVSLLWLMAMRRTHLFTFLQQKLVIFTQRDAEYDGGNILEAVDPFLPLASLAANIEHTMRD